MSGVDPQQLDGLLEPTPANEVKQRQGPGGRMLSYVDARYVMGRLDELGQENWQRRHSIGPDGKVSCDIGIRIADEWVWKGDGAGDTDIEGTKGSFSDSFKRAAVNWGIARDLYGSSSAGSSPRPVSRPSAAVGSPAAAADEPPFPGFEGSAVSEGRCRVHDKPWRTNSRGYYCATKVGDDWCKEQPSKAYQARQEVAS